jgi:hypothetical protein
MYILLFLFVFFAAPGFMYLLRNVQDANGIKRDISISLFIGGPCLALWFIVIFACELLNVPILSELRVYISSSSLIVLSLCAVHLSSVVWPVWNVVRVKSWRQQKKRMGGVSDGVGAMKREWWTQWVRRKSRFGSQSGEVGVNHKSNRFQRFFDKREKDITTSNSTSTFHVLVDLNPDSFASFLCYLRQPHTCSQFKKFVAMDFNIEAMVFYESVVFLRRAFDMLLETGQVEYHTELSPSTRVAAAATSGNGGAVRSNGSIKSNGSLNHGGFQSPLGAHSIIMMGAPSSSPALKDNQVAVVKDLSKPAQTTTTCPAIEAIQGQYHYIYSTFLAPGSLMEVKCLSSHTKSEIRETVIVQNRYERDVFEKAEKEVLEFLFRDVWGKYVRWLEKNNDKGTGCLIVDGRGPWGESAV